ncbi:LOW QUALITY PROTEIN: Hypothetical protein PHPALM_16912 [Phytophthora palmivora]|uniref:Tc1-like transposase DDE domain-containing protein n=1 Tax=Phytophthora palmivora TaxID=4796 RepID=A0A2P4XNJ2_9STRA|nr:LOW QUALITY PROTEIN: Hypothetical protein PHPALM_16912 [Phytophthora palmivora]
MASPQPPLVAYVSGLKVEPPKASELQGGDWMLVAHHNGIPPTTARRLVDRGSPERWLTRGNIKCTPEIEEALVSYLEDNCLLTLKQMQDMVRFDFGVNISTSLISQKLTGRLYSVKQVRVEPTTCNSDENIAKRRQFAVQLLDHIAQGRAPKGKRAVHRLPPSKGKNLQIQCAVSTEVGLVCFKTHRGSIKMEQNAVFVDTIYDCVKDHATYKEHFSGKPIVVTTPLPTVEQRSSYAPRNDLILLRLGPYSPMCNPIEGCFSVLKAKIKRYLTLHQCEIHNAPVGQMQEQRMQLLERAASSSMSCMDVRLVGKMALHCAHSVAAAKRGEPMQYGT